VVTAWRVWWRFRRLNWNKLGQIPKKRTAVVRYRRNEFFLNFIIVVIITTTTCHNHSTIITTIVVIVRLSVRLYDTFQNSYRTCSVKSWHQIIPQRLQYDVQGRISGKIIRWNRGYRWDLWNNNSWRAYFVKHLLCSWMPTSSSLQICVKKAIDQLQRDCMD